MSSSLPRAVLEAEQRADKLHQELLNRNQQPPESNDQATPPAQQASDTPPTPPEPPATPSDSTPPPVATEDTVEHRYKVLQGKYNSEVPRLAAEKKDLERRLQDIEQQFEALKTATPPTPLVKPEEIELYGEGLIDVARRIAREELAGKQTEIDSLRQKLDSLSNVTTQKVEGDFFKSLTDAVPDWQQINEQPGFLKWLEEFDDLAGESRQAMLTRAEKSRDAVRTAKFFTAFKKASSSWAANSQSSLASQVTPPASPAPNAPPAKKVWQRGEVADFYARLRRGEISDADAVAIEADLHAAQIEGRIR